MKRVTIVLSLVLAMSLTSFANKRVATGKTFTEFGNYKIERLDSSADLLGEEVTTYLITYEKSPMTVKVLVDKGKDCKTFIVVSDCLAVQYTCNGSYFGVEKIAKKYNKDGFVTDDDNLNRSQYFSQKVITREEMSEPETASLIACFFPSLLKEELIAAR